MDKDQAVADGLYIQIGKEVDDKYIEILKTQVKNLMQLRKYRKISRLFTHHFMVQVTFL